MVTMKSLIILQELSSVQGQRIHLRVQGKIGISEQGKVGTWSHYRLRSVCKEREIITCIYPTESGGMSEEAVIISCGAIATSHLSINSI